jgi:hypothetical protein
MWFAVAAVIPVAYYFVRFGDSLPIFGGSPVLTAGAPILSAAICGFLFGSTILDAEEIKSAGQAARRGLLVVFLSYFLLFTVPFVISAFGSCLLNGFGGIIELLVFFAFIFFYGLFAVGWLAALVGAAAGFLLYPLGLKSRTM